MEGRAFNNRPIGTFPFAPDPTIANAVCSPRREILSVDKEDNQAQFYQAYRKVAEEYDKEFLKKYEEDLNTTLIFVSSVSNFTERVLTSSQAGLFSAVASAFIILVDPQLKPDSGDETAALLRILIYKIDNTTFGNDVPTLPQWTGPPRAMVDVQTILFASLALSLLSAFLAMLGKQWLNRYDSADMRGSAIDRCQNRQRKLDGIVTWSFDPVMESLPLMLQVALLLLGCALSRYLWDTSITVASIVLGITSFGALFYAFIIVAGTAFDNCPYQTPASRILRYLGPNLHSSIPSVDWSAVNRSAVRNAIRGSVTTRFIDEAMQDVLRGWSRGDILAILVILAFLVLGVPLAFTIDVSLLGRGAVQALLALSVGVLRLTQRAWRRLCNQLQDMCSSLKRRLTLQTTPPELRCILWTLQTSLDKPVHLSTLKRLATMPDLTGLDPSLTVDCFNILVGCLGFSNGKVVVIQGLEQLATVSAKCFLHTFRHLTTVDPASSVLATVRRRYNRMFPFGTDFRGLSFYCTIIEIHALVSKDGNPRNFEWDYYKPPGRELTPFARDMAEVAQVEHQDGDVPRWILLFAFRCLSLVPPPPASVTEDCLTIIATNLGCRLSDFIFLDEKYRYSNSMGAHISDQGLVHAQNKFQASSPRNSKRWMEPWF